ncbi:MAG: NEW3 domain-containing protein [Candidatus Aenigmatarchaeota archaeon]
MLRTALESISPSAIAGRLASLSKTIVQAAAPTALAGRTASIARALSQQFGLLSVTIQSFEFTYNRIASAYITTAGAVARGFEAVRAIQQFVAANIVSSRISAVTKAVAQSLAFGQYVEKVFGILRWAAQSLSAETVAGRLALLARAVPQNIDAAVIASRAASIFRTLSQSFAAADLSKTLSSFGRALAQAIGENIAIARAQSLYKTLSQSLAANAIASRIPIVMKTLTQAASVEALSTRLAHASRTIAQSANVGLAMGRIRDVFRSMTQSVSATMQANTLDIYSRIANAVTPITASVAKLRQAGRLATQSLPVSGNVARVFDGIRAALQSLGWSAMPQRVAVSLRATSQSLASNSAAGTLFGILRTALQTLSPDAIAGRLASLSKVLAQAVATNALAGRVASITRTLSQSFGLFDITRQSFELTYNKLVTAYITAADAVARGFDAARAIPQSVATNVIPSRISYAIKNIAAQLQASLIAGRFSAVTKAVSQSLDFGQRIDKAFGILRWATQSLSADAVAARLATIARAVPQALGPAAIAARVASMFRTLSQSVSYSSQIYNLVFKSYETFATAAMQVTGNAGRLVSALRTTMQSLAADIAARRIFGGIATAGDALGISSAAARVGEAVRNVPQSLYSASAAASAFVRSRVAMLGLALGDVAGRLASVSRITAQLLSVENAAKLPSFAYDRITALAVSISDALQKLRMAGRAVTGALTLTDAAGRMVEFARATGHQLSAASVVARAASFQRNLFTALSVLFGWFFRFPAWAYSSQPTCEAAGYYWCSGACTTMSCDTRHNVTYANVTADQQMQVNATGTNVSIALLSNTTLNNVAFDTWSYEDTPAATTLAADMDTQSLKYFNVTANSTLNATVLQWLMMKFEYTDSEVSTAGLAESTLSMYTYNETLGLWVQLSNSSAGVFATGIDTAAKYAWVNKTNMSLYALGGLYVNGHVCSVSAECYSGACCSSTCQNSCAATPSPTPSPGGGGGSIITPPAESDVKYKKIAVLREVMPGQAVVVVVEVKNEGAIAQKGMELTVSGMPASWISKSVSSVDVQSSDSKGFNIIVSPPTDAIPGDYKVTLNLKNAVMESESFFIVRVRNIPADYDKPIVLRQVNIDKESGRTDVGIVVSNPYRDYERVDVIESIPRELANSIEYVDFDTKPSTIVRNDLIVMWSITGMAAGETRTFSYSVSNVLDEFAPYIYWPLRQLNVIAATAPSTMKLTGFAVPYFTPGLSSDIRFKVRNTDAVPHDFTFGMELPAGWKMNPEGIKETLAAGEEKEFRVSVTPAADAKAGRHMVRAAFGWDDTHVIKEYVAETATAGLSLVLIAAVGAVFAIGAWYGYRIRAQVRPQVRDRLAMNEKLGRIRDAIRASRPVPAGRGALESELRSVRELRTGIELSARHDKGRPIPGRLAAVHQVRNILRRRSRPWRDYWS